MANIKSLYRDYIQKSRLFLYPLLEIKRGVSVTPVQTYMSWAGKYSEADSKLVCVYHMRDDQDFKIFEEVKLLGNPLFHEFHELEDSKGVYVFDISEKDNDFWNVVKGRYSKLSDGHKALVSKFFKDHRSHSVYIQSYLYPKSYFTMYSELLTSARNDVAPMYKRLKRVGELCNAPDLEKEALTADVKVLDMLPIAVNLSD